MGLVTTLRLNLIFMKIEYVIIFLQRSNEPGGKLSGFIIQMIVFRQAHFCFFLRYLGFPQIL